MLVNGGGGIFSTSVARFVSICNIGQSIFFLVEICLTF